ncbi:uncharacterized protein LOC130682660 [Manis pentadactyla]|uniref:uncharacterized protein LOC130682660 n=1 Tax=Manis pentadactyla TaxID=143292 RepID=UPI00255CF139|nr:uncharacterized protein LOC130682660 [Manis pentadactyla]
MILLNTSVRLPRTSTPPTHQVRIALRDMFLQITRSSDELTSAGFRDKQRNFAKKRAKNLVYGKVLAINTQKGLSTGHTPPLHLNFRPKRARLPHLKNKYYSSSFSKGLTGPADGTSQLEAPPLLYRPPGPGSGLASAGLARLRDGRPMGTQTRPRHTSRRRRRVASARHRGTTTRWPHQGLLHRSRDSGPRPPTSNSPPRRKQEGGSRGFRVPPTGRPQRGWARGSRGASSGGAIAVRVPGPRPRRAWGRGRGGAGFRAAAGEPSRGWRPESHVGASCLDYGVGVGARSRDPESSVLSSRKEAGTRPSFPAGAAPVWGARWVRSVALGNSDQGRQQERSWSPQTNQSQSLKPPIEEMETQLDRGGSPEACY